MTDKSVQSASGTATCCSECDYNVPHDGWRFGGAAGRLATKILRDYDAKYGEIAERVYGADDDGLGARETPDPEALLQRLRAEAAAQGYGYQCRDDGSYRLSSLLGAIEIAPYHASADYHDAGDRFGQYQHLFTVGEASPSEQFLASRKWPAPSAPTEEEAEELIAYFEDVYAQALGSDA